MTPLWLDFQQADPRRRHPGLLLLGLALAVAVATLAHYAALVDTVDTLEQRVAQLKREAARQRPLAAAHGSQPADDGSAASPSAARWEALFAALEAAGDESMTLLGVQPGVGTIRLAGEAKTLAASMDYAQRLQSAAGLSNVHLTQSEVVAGHPQRPFRFALAAEWREPRR